MKIYNETKTELLENPDLEKGYLRPDEIVSKTIPAVEAVEEVFHYEYEHYDNGGSLRRKVVDVPAVEAQPERYEYEEIRVYIPFTEEELLSNELFKLTNWFDSYFAKQLQQSQWQDDFTVSHDKYFDKDYTDLDELKVQAKIVRDRIREIKNILKID